MSEMIKSDAKLFSEHWAPVRWRHHAGYMLTINNEAAIFMNTESYQQFGVNYMSNIQGQLLLGTNHKIALRMVWMDNPDFKFPRPTNMDKLSKEEIFKFVGDIFIQQSLAYLKDLNQSTLQAISGLTAEAVKLDVQDI